MTGPGCYKKHTEITSEAQRRFVGAVKTYQETGKGSVKIAKAAKSWPSKGPSSPTAHLKEVEGKELKARKGLGRMAKK